MKFPLEEVLKSQERIVESIYEPSDSAPALRISGLLKEIIDADSEYVQLGMGDVGVRLQEFAQAVDLDHPGLMSLFNGNLVKPSSNSRRVAQYMELARFAKDHNLIEVLPDIPKMAIKHIDRDVRHIDKPYSQYVRLLKSKEDRDAIRRKKEIKHFDISFLAKKSAFNWEGHASNCDMYLRYSKGYEEEIEKAKKKAIRYKNLNCTTLYKEIINSITEFRTEFENNYYGFHQITVSKVAVILAKLHGVQFIPAPFRMTDRHPIEDIGGDYVPRIYPFHEYEKYMNFFMSKTVVDIVKYLESFPAANNKPIFDHFLVVVPGLDCRAAFKEDDAMCIKLKYVCPVLLGETEGKCYFVCYAI